MERRAGDNLGWYVDEVLRNQREIEKAEQDEANRLQRERSRQAEWWNPDDVREWHRQRRAEARLAALPHDLVCPLCKIHRPNPWSWVMKARCCKSCYAMGERSHISGVDAYDILVQGERVTYEIGDLQELREMIGMSQKEFAARAGWSQPRQSQLEREVGWVNAETLVTILGVLSGVI